MKKFEMACTAIQIYVYTYICFEYKKSSRLDNQFFFIEKLFLTILVWEDIKMNRFETVSISQIIAGFQKLRDLGTSPASFSQRRERPWRIGLEGDIQENRPEHQGENDAGTRWYWICRLSFSQPELSHSLKPASPSLQQTVLPLLFSCRAPVVSFLVKRCICWCVYLLNA